MLKAVYEYFDSASFQGKHSLRKIMITLLMFGHISHVTLIKII